MPDDLRQVVPPRHSVEQAFAREGSAVEAWRIRNVGGLQEVKWAETLRNALDGVDNESAAFLGKL